MASVARSLAVLVQAIQNCRKTSDKMSHNPYWLNRHQARLDLILKEHMPHGSGIDNGVKLDIERSSAEKLVFTVDYHHMNEDGYYDGWTHHVITVRSSLAYGLELKISGPDRNGIKDYLHETFFEALSFQYNRDKIDQKMVENGFAG